MELLKQLINEGASITERYRALEKEFEALNDEIIRKKLNVKFEPKASGNIWENCRVLERNIESAKKALSK